MLGLHWLWFIRLAVSLIASTVNTLIKCNTLIDCGILIIKLIIISTFWFSDRYRAGISPPSFGDIQNGILNQNLQNLGSPVWPKLNNCTFHWNNNFISPRKVWGRCGVEGVNRLGFAAGGSKICKSKACDTRKSHCYLLDIQSRSIR